MNEVFATDIWDFLSLSNTIVISGCWQVNKRRELIMARGAACQLKHRYPIVPRVLGSSIDSDIRLIGLLQSQTNDDGIVWYVPSKITWNHIGEISVISRMLRSLRQHAANRSSRHFYITRWGCGSGGLDWGLMRHEFLSKLADLRNVTVVERNPQ